MDLLTQGLFGATIAQASGLQKKWGTRVLFIGFFIALLPDFDFWGFDRFARWQSHRGITHSLITGPLFAIAHWSADLGLLQVARTKKT